MVSRRILLVAISRIGGWTDFELHGFPWVTPANGFTAVIALSEPLLPP